MVRLPPRGTSRALIFGAALHALSCGGERAPASLGAPLEVAVAANFAATLDEVRADFERATGTPVRLSVGSTGSLYAQIRRGAPFDVFLAADVDRPRRLDDDGFVVPGSRMVYALGRLAVFAPRASEGWQLPGSLRAEGVRVAWANPRIAPYGAAAEAVLASWGLTSIEGALGESVGQVYQYVASGAADFGFVAGSQVNAAPAASVRWVSPDLHPPIVQEAVILARSRHPAAADFLSFLGSESVRGRLEARGYAMPRGRADGG